MKIKYLKLKNWLLVTLGGLLGVTLAGCEEQIMTCEYGTPEATYHVKGTVTNAEGQPIKGIGVVPSKGWDSTGDSVRVDRYLDTTDADGRYNVTFDCHFPRTDISLELNDIDGVENGNYQDTIVTIKTDATPLTGASDHWYEGEGTIIQNVVMTEKTEKCVKNMPLLK